MALATIASGAYGAAKTLGFDLSDLNPFSSNRGDKREKRDALRNQLWNAGVSRSIFTDIHSDNWAELQKIVQFVKSNGQDAIAYINDTRPGTPGGNWAQDIISGYQVWKQQNAGMSASPVPGMTPTQSGSGSGSAAGPSFLTQQNTLLGILAAGVLIAIFALKNG